MKIGDYVKNDNGLIGKIIGFKGDMVETDNERLITYKNSHIECKIKEKPIDLIEVGDVIAIKEDIDNYKKTYILGIPDLIIYDEIIDKIKNDNIRLIGIVTKEQFESIKYEVSNN